MSEYDESANISVCQLKTLHAQSDVRITHTILGPGEEIPWHAHSEVTDTFYVVKGVLTIMMRIPTHEVTLRPGETHQTSARQQHRVVNNGTSRAEFFLIQGIGVYDFKRADVSQ